MIPPFEDNLESFFDPADMLNKKYPGVMDLNENKRVQYKVEDDFQTGFDQFKLAHSLKKPILQVNNNGF